MRSSMMTDDVRPFGDSVRERIYLDFYTPVQVSEWWRLFEAEGKLPPQPATTIPQVNLTIDHYFDGTTHRFRFTDLIDYEQSHHFPGNKLICLTDEYWCQPNLDRHSVLKNLYDKTVTQCEEWYDAGKS